MICDEFEFRASVETLAKLYGQRDRAAAESSWTESGRRDTVESIDSQIRQIRDELADYLRKSQTPERTQAREKAA